MLRAEHGAALVTTPGRDHFRELRELVRQVICDVRGRDIKGPVLSNPFDADQAAGELPDTFSIVESYVRTGRLAVTEVDPIVAWIDSQQGPDLDALIEPNATWDDVLNTARNKAAAATTRQGNLQVTTEVAAFVCRR